MIARLMRLIGWRRLANLLLLLAVLGSLSWGLSAAIKGFDHSLTTAIILLGLFLAMVLAQSHGSGNRAMLILFLSGPIGLVIYFAGLVNPWWAILRSYGSIPDGLLTLHTWPDLSPLALAWHQLTGQLSALLTRIAAWSTALIQGNHGVDPLITSLLWSLAVWMITTWAGWAIFRLRRPLPAIAPAGILLAGVLNVTQGRAILLAPLVAATLLLMALSRYEVEEQYWVRNRIDYAEDIRLDMITVIPLLVIGLTVMAAITPSISVKQIAKFIREVAQPYQQEAESMAESLGLEQPPAIPSALGSLRSPGLPRQHLLGSGPELSQQVVMVVQTGDLPPVSTLELLPHPPGQYYWRSLTYDIYSGRGWSTSTTEAIQYKAGQPAVVDISTENPSIRMVEQAVYFSQDSPGVLFATGLLVTADIDFEVAWRAPAKEIADAFGVAIQANSYTATSLLTTASAAQLRSAAPVYPDWVLARYLTLPDSLPQRVRALAFDLTRGQTTPYDQALAIETHLRSYPYNLDVPAPPPDQDVADYFLFDLKEGYCDYYATAMVVLSRAAGLPARLVSGYASGSYDAPNARYVVTANNAHSWVEIYFSGIGWVEFEPTGGLPTITRREDENGLPQAFPEPKPVRHDEFFHWVQGISWAGWLLGTGGAALTFVLLWYLIEKWRWQRMPASIMLVRMYQRLKGQGERLAIAPQAGDTPFEYGGRLRVRFTQLTQSVKYGSVLSPAAGELDHLIQLYARDVYSPHPISANEHKQAVRTWMRLRWRLFAASLTRCARSAK